MAGQIQGVEGGRERERRRRVVASGGAGLVDLAAHFVCGCTYSALVVSRGFK